MGDAPVISIKSYTLEQYLADLDSYGLEGTWESIISALDTGQEPAGIASVSNIGELYEIGLAHTNKIDKKEQGKYFTPDDVAHVMSRWLLPLPGANVADVCCGTGNLIVSYLQELGANDARNLISDGRLYLYDQDGLALRICKSVLGSIYGRDIADNIHVLPGDFLDKRVQLPCDCKVISNPPYSHISEIEEEWEDTQVLRSTKEFYSAIMEKILEQSAASVIITPHSFIGGAKFLPLRKIMDEHSGFIVSFDNVPGNIFSGRKHGIFNTNNANSVRAAITVTENEPGERGFRCSNLIRFKTDERERLLRNDVLEGLISERHQVTGDDASGKYVKCLPALAPVFDAWHKAAGGHVIKELYDDAGGLGLCVPNTCRYFSVASARDLNRTGKIDIHVSDPDIYDYLYCLFNSSLCYWHWRLYDGGITYAKALLGELPDIYHVLDDEQKKELSDIAHEMRNKEGEYLSYKKNAGAMQENIKFPDAYRERINDVFLQAIGVDGGAHIFDPVHNNHAFEESDDDE